MSPCRDGGPSAEQIREERDIPKVLCAILTCMEKHGDPKYIDNFFADVDWQEAGVDVDWVRAWWEKHKIEDRYRREREAAQRREDEIARAARERLTPEERRILGI